MENEKESQEKILEQYAKNVEAPTTENKPNDIRIGPPITEVPNARMPWMRDEHPLANTICWIQIPMKELPTQGLFYPQDTVIAVRSATGAEIRHWSTLQEDDLSALDDMLNYVIERCVTIKIESKENLGERKDYLSWKDIKEIDRFYLLLAVHELTFPNGENKLQVKVSDKMKVDVRKEMINYITFDPQLMRYYNEDERCFILKPKGGQALTLDIPSVGVTQWLKQYIIRKQRMQEVIDEDYLNFAPFVIRSWRGLNDDVYHKLVEDSNRWTVTTISLMVQFKKLFSDTINPVIRFKDEGGVEQVAPLNFQGGIKSLFLISDPFEQLE